MPTVLTLWDQVGWKEQSAAASENLAMLLSRFFETTDNRVRGGISGSLDHSGAENASCRFESRVDMTNRDLLKPPARTDP